MVPGEHPFALEDATRLVSQCAVGAGHTWSLDAGHTQCLIVQPDWNPASSYAPYALTDDVKLITLQDKSTKRITHVRLLAQDVIGEAGIQHGTDWIPVAVPVVPAGTAARCTCTPQAWRSGVSPVTPAVRPWR